MVTLKVLNLKTKTSIFLQHRDQRITKFGEDLRPIIKSDRFLMGLVFSIVNIRLKIPFPLLCFDTYMHMYVH